jgi:hypothetical protein
LGRGEAARAFELAESSLARRAGDNDPWRQFLYGHYPQFPDRLAELRKQVNK